MKILVTGGAGFLGQHVVRRMLDMGWRQENVFVPRSADYDLTMQEDVQRCFDDARPEVVIHLAAVVGGIGANRERPGEFFYKNIIMGAILMEEARLRGIKRFVAVGTVCSYPSFTPIPFKEEALWNGYPEDTNAPYGMAKKMLLVQARAYRQQYGFDSVYLIPVNLYGPGDNFAPRSSHVIPALIRKFVEARDAALPSVVVWGSGDASREFLYVEDCADAIVIATERHDCADPINLGTGRSITIRELVHKVAGRIGYVGDIVWDRSYPDGQHARQLDVRRAAERLGWKARVSLDEGLDRTVDWYEREGRLLWQ